MSFSMSAWWEKIIAEYKEGKPSLIVFDKNIYNVCNENTPFMRGFDGRKFTITRLDGTIFTSTNVWYLSRVTEEYEHIFKNNVKNLTND